MHPKDLPLRGKLIDMVRHNDQAKTVRVVPRRKALGFLDLPGELRNKIYALYFGQPFRVEIVAKGKNLHPDTPRVALIPAGTTMSNLATVQEDEAGVEPRALRMPRRLGHYKRVDGHNTSWMESLTPLVYVNKKVYSETIAFLYQNTTFVFDSARRIDNFCTTVRNRDLSCITTLQLHYSAYGPSNNRFEQAHIDAWIRSCKALSQQLLMLHNLEVWIQSTTTVSDTLKHPYLKPLYSFRRRIKKSKARPFHVKVHFWSHWLKLKSPRPGLEDANKELHQLYGDAIAYAMRGWSERDALAELRAAWEKHKVWQHHFHYLPTEW